MPGTVQELASTFREAIDSQGNVLNMGVVQEVVLALERSPLSASVLKDLKSTRLGKYINQVRRNISDKTLAKRMKRLVIQWRSLAQRAPSTPNGIPGGSPPSLAVPTSSPPSLVVATVSTPAQDTPPPSPVATHLPDLSSRSTDPPSSSPALPSSSPALPPPSRPPSQNPPSHRKRLHHKLSTVKSLSNASHPPPQSTSQVLTLPSTQSSPSPPLGNSFQNDTATRVPSPQSPSLSANTVSPHVLAKSLPSSAPPPSSPAPLNAISGTADTAVPSLPVSLPLNSVVQGLVVRIPLVHVKPSKPSSGTQSAGMTPIVGQREKEKEREQEKDQRVPEMKSQALIVSVSRQLLERHLHTPPMLPLESSRTGGDGTSPAQEQAQDLPPRLQDLLPRSSSPQKSVFSPGQSPGQACVPNGHCPGVHGCYGPDGLWYSWTEPIMGQNYAVNVLPYVYIDGLDEAEEA